MDAPDLDALRRQLHGTDRLLLLDNFESVMSAADFVQRLAATPGVRVLVTSQRDLDVSGERIVKLEPMANEESKRLFVELAQRKDPTWRPDDDAAMREILVATDGLPYLIELVAPVAPKRRLRDLAKELTNIRAKHPLKERHASVNACLEWALARLPAEEREALPRLSIFASGFDADAARDVAQTPLTSLDVLVDASLLRFNRETVRYSMLATTRQFGRGLLNEDEQIRLAAAHASWFIERLDRADDALRAKGGDAQKAARRWIDSEYENVQQAVDWAEGHEQKLFNRAVYAYGIYLLQTCHFSERVRLSEAVLRRLSIEDDAQAWATTQNNLGEAYRNLPTGDRSQNLAWAIACYEAALTVWTERVSPNDWAEVQVNLGNAYCELPSGNKSDNLAKGIACNEAALRVLTERDFPANWAVTQVLLGRAYWEMPTGDPSENVARAIVCCEVALRVATKRDFPVYWATTQLYLGDIYVGLLTGDRTGNLAKAIACYEAALTVWTERDFPTDWAQTQNNLGNTFGSLSTGDPNENLAKAVVCYEAALRIRTERDFPGDWAQTQYNLGLVYERMAACEPREHRQRAIFCYESAARGFTAAGLTDKAGRACKRAAALKVK